MEKAMLCLALVLMMVFTACAAEQAANDTAANNAADTTTTNNAEDNTTTDNLATGDAEALYSFWKTMYDEKMADRQPAQRFSTEGSFLTYQTAPPPAGLFGN